MRPTGDNPAVIQVMVRRRTGDKALLESMNANWGRWRHMALLGHSELIFSMVV